MNSRRAEQSEANSEGTSICGGEGPLEFISDRHQGFIEGGSFGKIHFKASPSQHVDWNKPNLLNTIVFDRYEHEAAFTRFVDVATLKIPGKDNWRRIAEAAPSMDVPKRPVVISFGGKIGDAAWRISRMSAGAASRRMKETYVEEIAPRCWVVLSQILWDSACRKALTVDCNAKMIDHMCFWSTGGEFVSIIRPFEATAHLICCVVIATNHGDAYVSLVESCKAGDEFKATFIVTPVAVENVAGDHNKIDFFVDSESDHFPKSAQSRAGNILGSAVSAFSQPGQGAVEMKIGGVNKSHECPHVGRNDWRQIGSPISPCPL